MKKRFLEQSLLRYWYPSVIEPQETHKTVGYKVFSYTTLIPSIAYKFIINLRRYLYKKSIFKSFRSTVPVIIVGNISVGGTGKTPVVIALAGFLKQHGFKPGIILRGYARKNANNDSILVTNDTNIDCIGDEAQLIYNRLKLPVAVGCHREQSINLLLHNTDCNIIISDDGLQHYKLQRDIEICVVDNTRRFGNNKLLPAGPLREEAKRIDQVDYILAKNISANNFGNYLSQSWLTKYSNQLKNNIFNVELEPVCFANIFTDIEISMDSFIEYLDQHQGTNVYAMSGTGNNKSFFDTLHTIGVNDLNIVDLPDHYAYENITDLDDLLGESSSKTKKIILTTEKDAVKIKRLKDKLDGKTEIYYLRVAIKFDSNFINDILLKINHLPMLGKISTKVKEEVEC